VNGSGNTITKTGAGTLTLGSGAVWNNVAFVLNNGTFELNGNDITAASLAGSGGTIQNTGANATFTVTAGGNNADTTFSGSFRDGTGQRRAALNKVGTGVLTLAGDNSASSALTTISGGVLRLNHANALSTGSLTFNGGVLGLGVGDLARTLGTSAGSINFSGSGGFAAYGADRTVTLNSGAMLTWASGNFVPSGSSLILAAPSADRTVTLVNPINFNGAARTVQVDNGSAAVDAVLSGVLSGTGSSGLTKTGAGTLRLDGSAANTYAGSTTVNGGELLLNKSTGVAAIPGDLTISAGTVRWLAAHQVADTAVVSVTGTLDLNGFAETIGGLTGSGTVALGSGTLTVNNSANSTFSGVISGMGGLIKQGSATLTLAGSAANTFTGDTVVQAGQLDLNKSGGNAVAGNLTIGDGVGGANADVVRLLASHQIADGATVTVASSGKFDLNGFAETVASVANSGSVEISGTLNVVSPWTNGVGGTVLLSGGVLTGGTFTVAGTVKGNGTIAANVNLGSSQTITVSGGHLYLTATATLSGGTVDGGPLQNQGTITGHGTLSVALSNPGYVRATGGTLFIQALTGNASSGTLEAGSGGILHANGITPWLNNGQVILAGGTVLGGMISNNATRLITGHGTIHAPLVNHGTLQAHSGGQTLTLNNTVVNHGTVTVSSQNLVVSGVFSNFGTFTMMQGNGTFRGRVINSGAWLTDPTTNTFTDSLVITPSGYIAADVDDVFIFTNGVSTVGHFRNLSTNALPWNTSGAKFLFSATVGATQDLFAAGINRESLLPSGSSTSEVVGDWASAIASNFHIGTLEISNFSTVRVWDAFSGLGGDFGADDGQRAALYVDNLIMGAHSLLIISANVEVYFLNSNSWSSANYVLLGGGHGVGGELHQFVGLSFVPEPGTLLLFMGGAGLIWGYRRQNHTGARGMHAGVTNNEGSQTACRSNCSH
ncbi:MAG: autotransporter-associated beta strand repeat-containing protein, partial [Verrucomicrobiales bacterium]|nr:autotransporter-associated beta strand repeat-containing protein [Verrucomicrobiales bacterium]